MDNFAKFGLFLFGFPAVRDREERLRLIKDRQNEERQKKLEELKAQALAAQRYREQKEEERKRRMDDMRTKENDKRQQVSLLFSLNLNRLILTHDCLCFRWKIERKQF